MNTETADREPGGTVRTAMANAMVATMKEHYGKRPTGAKAWILEPRP